MWFLRLLCFGGWAWLITASRTEIHTVVDQIGLDEFWPLILILLYGAGLLVYPFIAALFGSGATRSGRQARRRAGRQRRSGAFSTVYQGEFFELHLKRRFEGQGFRCEHVGKGGHDGGADLILSKRGRRVAVQAKYWRSGYVGDDVVYKVHQAKALYGCHEAWIITTGRFTQRAQQVADMLGVRLYDIDAVARWEANGWPASIPPHPSYEA